MTNVANAISALLYTHDAVIVPGLGAFLCHAEGAKVNVITNQFEKPSATVDFDASQREENDLVVNYLVANEGITVEEARQLVMEFVSDCFARLKVNEEVELPGVGTLSFEDNQEMVFRAAASNDFNGDAFGLDNFAPKPVFGSGSSTQHTGSVGQETSPQSQGTKTEPDDDVRPRHTWWIWVMLFLLAAGGGAWWYLNSELVPAEPVPTKPWPPQRKLPEVIPEIIPDTTLNSTPDTTVNLILDTISDIAPDTASAVTPATPPEVMPSEPQPSTEQQMGVIIPDATSKAFIVGGCFSIEQNALNMTAEAHEQGCASAFTMKRGSKYYVCYGQYPTTADAKSALPEVLSNYNPKAWILTK